MVLGAARGALSAAGSRLPLLVECNNKKGLGVTMFGTRRKRARVSGFRARNASVGGRKVLHVRKRGCVPWHVHELLLCVSLQVSPAGTDPTFMHPPHL